MSIISIHGNLSGKHVTVADRGGSTLYQREARISRRKTLDGGVVVAHSGQVAGDSDIILRFECSDAHRKTLQEIFETDTIVFLSCREGYFSGYLNTASYDGKKINLNFMILEKIL